MQASPESGLTGTSSPAPNLLPARKAKAKVIKKKPLPKACRASRKQLNRKESSDDRLAAIEAAHFTKEVAHITAERDRKIEMSARRKGLKPAGTTHLSLNRETLSVSWAVEIGDFGSSILFDLDNGRDAKAAGAIFAETHKKDIEGISAVDLAMIPIASPDDSEIDNSKCLIPRYFKGYYYNAQN